MARCGLVVFFRILLRTAVRGCILLVDFCTRPDHNLLQFGPDLFLGRSSHPARLGHIPKEEICRRVPWRATEKSWAKEAP